MRYLILLLAIAGVPASAAGPVDLHCNVMDGTKATTIDITLNEAARTMTWQWANDPDPISGPAIFSATKVVMKTITLDRVHLGFEQRYDIGDGPVVKRGTCQIAKVTRAF